MNQIIQSVRIHNKKYPFTLLYDSENYQKFEKRKFKTPEDKAKTFVEFLVKKRYSLQDADLTNICLDGANLVNANLVNATFAYVDLNNVNLTGADMSCTDLTGVTFINVNLTNANLHQSNLAYADLKQAKLEGTKLTGSILEQTEMDLKVYPENYETIHKIPIYTLYTNESYVFGIGCKIKTATKWNYFFSAESTEEYDTTRYSVDWYKIKLKWETFYKHWQEEFVELSKEFYNK